MNCQYSKRERKRPIEPQHKTYGEEEGEEKEESPSREERRQQSMRDGHIMEGGSSPGDSGC